LKPQPKFHFYLRLVAIQNELEPGKTSESAEMVDALGAALADAESDSEIEPAQDLSIEKETPAIETSHSKK
jgi:hypothetical protein